MKDSPTRAIFPGHVVPALLSLLAFVNLWNGPAYWSKQRSGMSVFTDDRREPLAQPLIGIAVLAAVADLGLFGHGFWVDGKAIGREDVGTRLAREMPYPSSPAATTMVVATSRAPMRDEATPSRPSRESSSPPVAARIEIEG